MLASSIAKRFDFWLFLSLLIGTSLIIACGCVINNYIDRGIDKKMARTKKRASVTGLISFHIAMFYAAALGILGFTILVLGTNTLTVGVGVLGLFFYLVMYSVGKRRSTWGTVIGSVSGATPILAGYTAVTGHLDSGAIILLLIMVCWQMPHFYAIAMYRFDDYKAAGLPVLPVARGQRATVLQVVAYIALFTLAVASLTLSGYTGYIYLIVMVSLGLWWLKLGLQGFHAKDSKAYGRKLFLFSLKVMVALSVMTALGALLP